MAWVEETASDVKCGLKKVVGEDGRGDAEVSAEVTREIPLGVEAGPDEVLVRLLEGDG